MKRYVGKLGGLVIVIEEGKPERRLNPRLDLRSHSPTGFAWGYMGSGPAQLALAILADALGQDGEPDALSFYQTFKADVIAPMKPGIGFELTEGVVLRLVETYQRRLKIVEGDQP